MAFNQKEYQREWRRKNKEKIKEYQVKYGPVYYQNNKDRLRPIRKSWEENNRDKRKAIVAKFQEEKKPQIKQKQKEWEQRNPEKLKQIRKKYNTVHKEELTVVHKAYNKTVSGVYRRYVHSAKKRGYLMELNQEEFGEKIIQDCHYCGTGNAGGVDRQDNKIGYTKENAVPCCTKCNMMKKILSVDDFISHATLIARYNNML